jgi:predicted nucleotidyltransferase
MIELVHQHKADLQSLCRRFGVRRLELFGSATSAGFDEARSDIDFLVEFEAQSPMGPFHQYFDFLLSIEKLLGRHVDLVEISAIRNPYFQRAIDQCQRTLLYAA